VAMLYK